MGRRNIVLIHGWASDESVWQEARRYLEPRYRLHTLNLSLAESLTSYRDAVLDLIAQNGLTKVILLGWSLGSLVAIQVASRVSSIVDGLVLVSGTSRFAGEQSQVPLKKTSDKEATLAGTPDPVTMPASLVRKMKKRLRQNPEQTLTDFYQLMFSAAERARGVAGGIMDRHLRWGRVWDQAEAQAGLDFLLQADLRSELSRLNCPTLLLHGAEDKICPLQGARFMQGQLPLAQLISYPGVGHVPFLTNPVDFYCDLEAWLSLR